jgi:hypothetical protein
MNLMWSRVRTWYRSGGDARRNAVAAGATLIMVGVITMGMVILGSPGQAEPLPVSPVVMVTVGEPPAAREPAPDKPVITPEYAWAAALTYLNRAVAEGDQAIGAAIAGLDRFFVERRAAAPAFAEEVLGFGGKMQAAGNLAAEVVNGVAGLLGQDRLVDQHQLVRHIKDCFTRHVLDETRLRKALAAAAASYVAGLADVESRLLVEIQADLPDGALPPGELPPMRNEAGEFRCIVNSSLEDLFNTSAGDLFIGTGKFAASWIGGDVLSGGLLGSKANLVVRLGGDMAAGGIMDQALDAATEAVGYKPADAIAREAQNILARIEFYVVEGDEKPRRAYFGLLDMSAGYPDEAVRNEFRRAVEAMEGHATIGLRMRLHKLNVDRSRHRAAVIYRHIFGQDAPLPPEILPPPIDPRLMPPVDQLIEDATSWVDGYGGRNP